MRFESSIHSMGTLLTCNAFWLPVRLLRSSQPSLLSRMSVKSYLGWFHTVTSRPWQRPRRCILGLMVEPMERLIVALARQRWRAARFYQGDSQIPALKSAELPSMMRKAVQLSKLTAAQLIWKKTIWAPGVQSPPTQAFTAATICPKSLSQSSICSSRYKQCPPSDFQISSKATPLNRADTPPLQLRIARHHLHMSFMLA